MSPIDKFNISKPREVAVILGEEAVCAYTRGELSIETLRGLGEIQIFQFDTLQEANAFMQGVDVGAGSDDAIAVDDLR